MTNVQVRLLAAAIAMVAGALAVSSNLGIVIILLSAAIFMAEYVRSYTNK
ncbi:hypothetical protein ACFLV3_04950 [Chloroflexota bacterium]